jgi:hypothetical protein
MKQFTLTLATCSMLALCGCGNADKHNNETPAKDSVATETPTAEATKETPPMDSAAQMKAWESYMTPGDLHKWMASTDGKWTGEETSWMAPGAPPSGPNKVSVENKTILGGRYQESVYKGKMMGMDFEGHGMLAYDNAKKKFVNTWVDNMGTGVMVMEGPYDENTKTITLTGKMMDPSTGKDTEMREVLKIIDDKTQVMEMYCTKDGKEFKNMEIKLAKK